MLKWIMLLIVAAIAAFAGYVAMLPAEFSVTRTAHIDAPPEAVFAQVNDYHNWQNWSPWAKLDPNAKATFEGANSGEGAAFAWSGNSEVGEGKMTITQAKPNERIVMRLNFVKPMQAINETVFEFAPEGNGTRMTWTMNGHNGFIGRAICVFVNMDRMVGGMFEKGMSNINDIVKPKS